MTVYRQDANPNATNSELDAKVIIKHPQLTSLQHNELVEQFVEMVVDNMDTKTLVNYVFDDLREHYENASSYELKDAVDNFDEDLYNELVENVTYVKCQSNNKNNVTYNEVDYVEQCITEGYDYRDCVDTLPGINNTKGKV
jgi:hypothetical protein